jgi:hypothetical protein
MKEDEQRGLNGGLTGRYKAWHGFAGGLTLREKWSGAALRHHVT